MVGLINNAVSSGTTKTPPLGSVQQANVTTYDPEKRSIDAAKETVSGQLDSLLKNDSPYLQQAKAGATQTANQRGLVNSSMAAGAGQAAAIGAALPVATSDASVYGTASRDNQSAANTALNFGANANNSASQFNVGQVNEFGTIGAQGTQTRQTQAAAGDITARIAALQGEIQTGLIGAQGAQTRMTDAQRAEKEKELAKLQGEIQTEQIGAQGKQARLTQAASGDLQKEIATLQAQLQTGLIGEQGAQTRATAAQQATAQESLAMLQGEQTRKNIAEQGTETRKTQVEEITSREKIADQSNKLQTSLQELRGTQSQDLADIQARNATLLQASTNASSFFTKSMDRMDVIMSNADTTPEQKQKAIDAITKNMRAGFSVIGGMANINVNDLLDWSDAQPNIPPLTNRGGGSDGVGGGDSGG